NGNGIRQHKQRRAVQERRQGPERRQRSGLLRLAGYRGHRILALGLGAHLQEERQEISEPLNQAEAGQAARDHQVARGRLRGRNCILIERTPMMDRAPWATVEALMYSLRRGVAELTRPDTRQRLSALDADQLKAVCRRGQSFEPEVATPWSPEETVALIA